MNTFILSKRVPPYHGCILISMLPESGWGLFPNHLFQNLKRKSFVNFARVSRHENKFPRLGVNPFVVSTSMSSQDAPGISQAL